MELSDVRYIKRKRSNRILIILLVIFLLGLIALSIAVCVLSHKLNQPAVDGEKCQTPECTITAGEMLARMDLSADPCQDFYQYACGAYARADNRAPHESAKLTFSNPATITRQRLATVLSSSSGPSTSAKKAKDFYAVCLNDTGDNDRGKEVLLEVISTLKSWPLASNTGSGTWSASTWDINAAMAQAQIYGTTPFFTLTLTFDPRDSGRNILIMMFSGLTLELPENYKLKTSMEAYRTYVESMLMPFVDVKNQSFIKNISQRLWSLESFIAYQTPSIYQKNSFLSDPSRIKTLREVQNSITFFNLTLMANRALEGSGKSVNPDTEILVVTEDYLKALNNIVLKLGNRWQEILSTYIVWTAIHKWSEFAGNYFDQQRQALLRNLRGWVRTPPNRWEYCVQKTVETMGFVAGAMYAMSYFEQEDREKIDNFLQITVNEFTETLPQLEWLQEETRERAKEKAKAVWWQIGFPEALELYQLDFHYSRYPVGNNLCRNMIAYKTFSYIESMKSYEKPMVKKQWLMMPTETNAFYSASTNHIMVLGGILQKPVYSRNFPLSVLYGSMGTILGHELIHGFDTTGKNFDSTGKVINWWDPKSAQAYEERAACFKNLYDGRNFQGQRINGELTLGENIADCGGIKLAYTAYSRAAGKLGSEFEEQLLPGLNMTGEQQFFLGYANLWCMNINDITAAQLVVADNHAQGPVRVNVVLQNTPQFAKAFSCPVNSSMNPSHRCQLW